ncbi:hypothetical protein EON77_22235, partial [bacterium]
MKEALARAERLLAGEQPAVQHAVGHSIGLDQRVEQRLVGAAAALRRERVLLRPDTGPRIAGDDFDHAMALLAERRDAGEQQRVVLVEHAPGERLAVRRVEDAVLHPADTGQPLGRVGEPFGQQRLVVGADRVGTRRLDPVARVLERVGRQRDERRARPAVGCGRERRAHRPQSAEHRAEVDLVGDRIVGMAQRPDHPLHRRVVGLPHERAEDRARADLDEHALGRFEQQLGAVAEQHRVA